MTIIIVDISDSTLYNVSISVSLANNVVVNDTLVTEDSITETGLYDLVISDARVTTVEVLDALT